MKSHFQLYKDEIDQLNAVFSAYKSEISDSDHLDTLGLIERHDVEIGGKTPDFLFFKQNYSLMIECKSGKINFNDKKQLLDYKKIRRSEIEKTIELLCEKKYEIYSFDVAVVYNEDNLLEDVKDSRLKRFIDDMVERDIAVLSIKRGGYLKRYKGVIRNSPEVDRQLSNGIQIPKYPKNEIGITRNSPAEGIVYYLGNKLIDIARDKKEISIKETDIYNEIFKNVEIKPERINKAIKYLKILEILEKPREFSNDLLFNIQKIKDFRDLIEKLKMKNLDDVVREKKGAEDTMPLKGKY